VSAMSVSSGMMPPGAAKLSVGIILNYVDLNSQELTAWPTPPTPQEEP